MQHWEYCAVMAVGMDGRVMKPYFPTLLTFNQEGTQDKTMAGKEYHEFGKLLARLGAEGWEMVGTGSVLKGEGHMLYFKRPLPQ